MLLIVAACGTTRQQKKKAEAEVSARIDVEAIARDVMNDVQHTARGISNRTEDREVRRQMIVWQINTAAYMRRALMRPDPRHAFVDIWTMLEATRDYASDERGAKLLGPLQDHAVEELDGMVARLETRARGILSKQQFTEINAAIDEFVRRRRGTGDEIAEPPSTVTGSGSAFNIILAVPDGIFSLGGGVKDTAVSISEVARAAEQGVSVMSMMPQMVRWQTELLLYAIEENDTVRGITGNLNTAANAISKVGATAESLPARVEETTTRLIREVEKSQPEFRATLAEGRRVVEETRSAIQDLDPVLKQVQDNGPWIEAATGHATEAGEAWEGAFEQLNLLVNPPADPRLPPPEPSPPFDMKDLVKTAEHATKTAEDVRAAVEDLRAVVEGDAAERHAAAIEATAVAAIGRLTTFAVTVILTFFAALLVYRLVSTRLARPPAA